MFRFVRRHIYIISVFFTGACVLVVEIAATRILSPFFGSTIFTVSSVIGVILAALSFGYYRGGKMADDKPSATKFFGLIAVSGISLLLFHYLGKVLLPVFSESLSLAAGPLISTVFLFFIPAFFMGLLSPYVVKLQSMRVSKDDFGSVAGTTFFWSTFGSIAGSLLTGFVFIPSFGVSEIMTATGIALVMYGGAGYLYLSGKVFRPTTLGALAFFMVSVSIWSASIAPDLVYAKDGVYEKLSIVDVYYKDRPTRVFKQDKSSSSAMFLDEENPTDFAFEYAKYYKIADVLGLDIEKVFIIGGGTYSIPRALIYDYPRVQIDVAEIEPTLEELSHKYFSLPETEQITTHTEDGRRFLSRSEGGYDLIFSDVYYSLFSIPVHFTTEEFFEVAKSKLASDGMFVGNMYGDLSTDQDSLILTLMHTFEQVFPNSYFFATESTESVGLQNLVFIGIADDTRELSFDSAEVRDSPDEFTRTLRDHLIDTDTLDLSTYDVLRDNYAPVEFYTGSLLKRSAL
jgi:spermidine synthase